MKPPRWASSSCKWLVPMLLAALLTCGSALADERFDLSEIAQAQFIIADDATRPPADAGWTTVSLPHRAPKPVERDLVDYWYKAEFEVRDIRTPLWVYFPKLRSGGAIFVNSYQVADIRGADQMLQVRWFRPHMRYLPPSALRQGTNQIAVHFAIREPLTSFGAFEIGPEPVLRAAHDQLLFWEDVANDVSAVVCVLSAVFILIFWVRRPQERLYGLFGLCVLFWGLRTFIFRMPQVAMDDWVLWRTLYYFTTCGFITCITIFLCKYSAADQPLLNRFLLANWIGGSLLFLLVGTPLRPFMDAVWTLSFLPFTVYAFLRLAHFAARERTRSSLAMVFAILFAIGLAMHDYAVQHGLFGLSEFYLMHLGIPAFLIAMGCVLLERFVTTLQLAETNNEQLASRIADRERALVNTHEQLRQLERERATTEERKRIMQDMHDGVGSQLLSTLVMVRRGGASQERMADLLQECLDDMRLVIDSLSPSEPDLLPVLGNLRFRMEERFRDVGLTLEWRNRDMPDRLDVAPHDGLQVLRIMQEALSNVLRHARASQVLVDIHFRPEAVCIVIEDNGIGFDGAERPGGRGIGNMKMRSSRIGARLTLQRLAPGTRLTLDLPLGRGTARAA